MHYYVYGINFPVTEEKERKTIILRRRRIILNRSHKGLFRVEKLAGMKLQYNV